MKEQVLLQPESVNKIIDTSEKSHEDRQTIISEFHDLPAAGHNGNKATYNALRKHYRWKGMKEQVQQYVKHCQCCQKGKAMNKALAGELLLMEGEAQCTGTRRKEEGCIGPQYADKLLLY